MFRDEAIGSLAYPGETGRKLIKIQQPALLGMVSQSAKYRFGAAINRTVRFNQGDSCHQRFLGVFQKQAGHPTVLGRKIFHPVSSCLLPASNPNRTKPALS